MIHIVDFFFYHNAYRICSVIAFVI